MSEYFKHYSIDKWIYKSTSSSTNEDMVETVSKNISKTNIVLYTYKQTAGKGQIGRKWFSGANNNLTFSIQFGLNSILAHNQFNLNMICSLALYEVMEQLSPLTAGGLSIKWPNDLYYLDRKLAGILIQNTIQGNKIVRMVLGVGLNVNESNFPKELPNPISLSQITQSEYNLQQLFTRIMRSFSHYLEKLDVLSQRELLHIYHSRMYLRNREKDYIITETGEKIKAFIKGVNENGQLLLENEKGVRKFNFREIRYC